MITMMLIVSIGLIAYRFTGRGPSDTEGSFGYTDASEEEPEEDDLGFV